MDRLSELLLEWEERRGRGEVVDPWSLCRDDPTLAVELAEQVKLLQVCERILTGGEFAGPPVPARIDKYEVRGVLGEGGMGVVYRGWDPALQRPVAIKTIHPQFAGSGVAGRFAREGRVLAQLKHPHVVTVFDAGTHDGHPYLAMEYVPGGSLADHWKRLTAAGPAVIARLMAKVARAVQAAHDCGVLHRDLKPQNILLGPGDEPLVADFGLAKLLTPAPAASAPDADTVADPPSEVTAGGFRPGTPAYMAPEQFDPVGGPIGPAADVWAVGVVLHELLTGGRLFRGSDREAVARQVRDGPPPRVAGQRTRTGRRLAAITARCLEHDPRRRYATAGELAEALDRATQPDRRLLLSAGVFVGALTMAGVARRWTGRPAGDPETDAYTDPQAVRATLDRLAKGEPVVLIDHDQPRGYRLPLGPASGQVRFSRADGFRVQSNGHCVVELLPWLPPGDWTVEAVLRHELAFSASEVGLAAGIASGVTGAGEAALSAFVVVYSELALRPQPPNNGINIKTVVANLRDSQTELFAATEFLLHQPRTIPDLPGAVSPRPRGLSLAITGPGAVGSVDGQPLPLCSPVRYETSTAGVKPGRFFLGGVGVYTKLASVRIDQFVVRPLATSG